MILIILLLIWLFSNPKAPKFEVGDRVSIVKCNNRFSKGYTTKLSIEILAIDYVLKLNLWAHRIKVSNSEKSIAKYCEKELLLNKL